MLPPFSPILWFNWRGSSTVHRVSYRFHRSFILHSEQLSLYLFGVCNSYNCVAFCNFYFLVINSICAQVHHRDPPILYHQANFYLTMWSAAWRNLSRKSSLSAAKVRCVNRIWLLATISIPRLATKTSMTATLDSSTLATWRDSLSSVASMPVMLSWLRSLEEWT